MSHALLSSRLRIRHLELFRHVIEQRTLQRAAERSHMTQPAATKLVQDMEDMFGLPLFERSQQGMKPTLFGEVLHRHVTVLIADLERMEAELRLVSQGAAGHIRLGVLPSLVPGLLTRAVALMLDANRSVRFTITESASNELLASLGRNELDLTFARVLDQRVAADLRFTRVYDEPFAIVARANHPLAIAPRRPTWQALSQADWVLPAQDTPMRAMVDELFIRHGTLRPTAAVECTTLEKVKDLIANTEMIGILPRSFVQHNDVEGGLATLKGDVSRFAPTSLVFRKHDGLAPVVEAFAGMVQRAARELELR